MINICSITILPDGVGVGAEIGYGLSNAAEINTDGAGFAIAAPDYVVRGRDMDARALTEEFALARAQWPQGMAVIHYRLATAKKPSAEHLHPFECGDGRFFFFNGSLPLLEEPGRSDARVLAEDVVSQLGSQLPALGAYIGRHNKGVVIGPGECYIGNADQWLTGPQGSLWSNADYLGRKLGWDEARTDDGELLRWSRFQPGQCKVCHLYKCPFWDSGAYEPPEIGVGAVLSRPVTSASGYRAVAMSLGEHCEPAATVMPRWRNETQRIASLT